MSWLSDLVNKTRETFEDLSGRFVASVTNLTDNVSEYLNSGVETVKHVTNLGDENVRGPFATREEAERYASEIPLPTNIIFVDPSGDVSDEDSDDLEDFPFFVEVEDSDPSV